MVDEYFLDLFKKVGNFMIPEMDQDALIFNPDTDLNIDGGDHHFFAGIDHRGDIVLRNEDGDPEREFQYFNFSDLQIEDKIAIVKYLENKL
jgi:hypothetical protein